MANFSEFCTHVEVAKEDAPVTVESGILRSMLALGCSSSVSNPKENGGDNVDDDNACASNIDENNNNADGNSIETNNFYPGTGVCIVEDELHDIGHEIHERTSSTARIIGSRLQDHPCNQPMTPRQLLYLGSIWYLPADDYRKNQELELKQQQQEQGKEKKKHKKIHNRVKPTRLSLSNATMMLQEGDYLRVHHTPRRFHRVYKADWSFPSSSNNNNNIIITNQNNSTGNDFLPTVIRQRGPGYCIIDKPPLIPVHSTVDNDVESVASQLLFALQEQHREQDQNTTEINRDPMDRNATNQARDPPYLAVVQRIDINTSGLLVLATSPEFAAYFSQLLRHKTATIINHSNNTNGKNKNKKNNMTNETNRILTIQKGYKCLVCIQPDESSGESVVQAWQRLSNLQRPKPPALSMDNNTNSDVQNENGNKLTKNVIRHYLKASDRAPKLFVDSIPDGDNGEDSKWYECLMEITEVGDPIPLFAAKEEDESSASMTDGLWPKAAIGKNGSFGSRMPSTTKAVVEVQVSLITGRTHQIRGQLSKLGFPIVGDEQYGGALQLPVETVVNQEQHAAPDSVPTNEVGDDYEEEPQLLALQCCHIRFPDAEYESVWHKRKHRDVLQGRPSLSGKMVQDTLEKAWWTPFLKKRIAAAGAGFNDIDFEDTYENVQIAPEEQERDKTNNVDVEAMNEIRSDLLPPPVQLCPGRNKYVIAKLRDPSTKQLRWFVQSAPLPYHAEVAFDLLEWIRSVPGYQDTMVEITGGGRIDYDIASSKVSVYGFSYRYGKGDHVRAAQLIEDSPFGADSVVTYDMSDKLY
eukprot:CAMPEP_0168172166 /NCGR_PEP_ID=MMETSP0139_2-20121125/5093_1 /TAXON_ID=44445 /ORGANISM="Pseudo-nitzschia australis, Strain 10249 10 AB" /LENGTH=808 /DNA_ID=CAMNT_0008089767 /DNA_START=396 /DNA_END=2821 /DNA_ORIENTATION=-